MIDNLLWKKGLLSSQIQGTRRLFAERSLDQRVRSVIRAFLFPGEDKGSCLLTPLSTDCY